MHAQQVRVDVIGHNLANIDTIGFKSSRVSFTDLLTRQTQELAEQETTAQMAAGIGTRALITPVLSQGLLVETGNQFDLALNGSGFYKVKLPDGKEAFTRGGSLSINPTSQMVIAGGVLDPVLTLPPQYSSFDVNENGAVQVTGIHGKIESLGTIKVYLIPRPEAMEALGKNLYATTPASGEGKQTTAATGEAGLIKQGFLEQGTVDPVTELTNLILAARTYTINARSIQNIDEMWDLANNLKR